MEFLTVISMMLPFEQNPSLVMKMKNREKTGGSKSNSIFTENRFVIILQTNSLLSFSQIVSVSLRNKLQFASHNRMKYSLVLLIGSFYKKNFKFSRFNPLY